MNDRDLQPREPDAFPDLFARLADDLTQLFDTKLTLLKVELKEDIDAYIRGGVMIAIGGVLAAIAFLISTLFENTSLSQPARYGIGFVITSLVYLAAGGALVVINKNRLAEQGLVPERTVAELKKDKERLQEEL